MEQKKRQRQFSSKLRTPLIAVNVEQFNIFLHLMQASTCDEIAFLCQATQSYIFREKNHKKTHLLNDKVGCHIIDLILQAYNEIPDDLSNRVLFAMLKKHDFLKDKDLTYQDFTLDAVFDAHQTKFAKIPTYKQVMTVEDLQNLMFATRLNPSKFAVIYECGGELKLDYRKIPSFRRALNYPTSLARQTFLERDKVIRVWLSLAFQYGVIDKNKAVGLVHHLSVLTDFERFTTLRDKFHADYNNKKW